MFENPLNVSSVFSKKVECEHYFFSSTPLYYSLDHNVDSFIVDLSKPPIFNDLPIDEVETPQVVESLQVELMVMSGPHCLEVDSAPD